jgi:hypothetical protein
MRLTIEDAACEDGSTRRRSAAGAGCTALCVGMLLGGCADSYVGARTLSVQGKFESKTCPELAAQHKTLSTQIDDLRQLTRKAEEGTGGSFVGAAVYGPTLAQARAERRLVEEALVEKRCPEEPAKPGG